MPSASNTFTDTDRRFMARALKLAERGRGFVEPNPLVGCVLVRNAHLLAEGWHRRFGGPHAEVDALARCTSSPAGATAYVTLEPCAHHGKTPPCADALITAGITRVAIPLADPHPAVAGRGLRRLRRAGIRVDVGLLRESARKLNAPFFKLSRQGMPYVILKWAQSLDGKIATRTGQSQWITGPGARRDAHRLRGRVDAVVVGIGTVLADDPQLTCRHVKPRRIATRVIVDTQLRTPIRSKLAKTANDVPTMILTARTAIQQHPRRARSLEQAGVEIVAVPTQAGHVNLRRALELMGRRQWTTIMVEGGGELLGAFFDHDLADEAHIYVAPRLIGGVAAPGPLGGTGLGDVRVHDRTIQVRTRRVGADTLHHVIIRANITPTKR